MYTCFQQQKAEQFTQRRKRGAGGESPKELTSFIHDTISASGQISGGGCEGGEGGGYAYTCGKGSEASHFPVLLINTTDSRTTGKKKNR